MSRTLAALALLAGPVARAESFSDLGLLVDQLPETDVFVDVLDAATENIRYTGSSPVSVFRPDGSLLGTFPTGSLVNPDQTGAYRFRWDETATWTLDVPGRSGGRVWSTDWRARGPGFGTDAAFDFEAYAVVDGGADGRAAIVRFDGQGTNAYVFRVTASTVGLPSAPGASVPSSGQVYAGEHRVYLEPPEAFVSDPIAAEVTGTAVAFASETCEVVGPGDLTATLTFEASARGTWRVLCDLDDDGAYAFVDGSEVVARGRAVQGTNTVALDGRAPDGTVLPFGTHTCVVHLAVGETHLVLHDVETVYPGLRFYEAEDAGPRPLAMWWDDSAVAADDVAMPDGEVSLVLPPEGGLVSGALGDAAVANVSARGWGRFTKGSKGNRAWMDTYAFVSADLGEPFDLEVADLRADVDGDTLRDVVETCLHGTDPALPDTDGDGVGDEVEVLGPSDPLLADTDGDGRPDGVELRPDGTSPDRDGDGRRDVRDDDDDGDGLLTLDETRDGAADDFDADGVPNHLDLDADGDGYSDRSEGTGDRDLDGQPDFLDPSTVGLGQTFGEGFFAGGCSHSGGGAGALALVGLLGLRRRRR